MCNKRPFETLSNEPVQHLIVEEMHGECLEHFTQKITEGKRELLQCDGRENTGMNAQGQVIVSLLSVRLIAVKSWICFPHYCHGTSFTQTNLKTASENILMAHACKAHTGQIDGMLWL